MPPLSRAVLKDVAKEPSQTSSSMVASPMRTASYTAWLSVDVYSTLQPIFSNN